MEKILNIPILEKTVLKKVKSVEASPCCTPKNGASSCCTPTQSAEENSVACCAQPEDGSECCNK
jgi:hypothetical protein